MDYLEMMRCAALRLERYAANRGVFGTWELTSRGLRLTMAKEDKVVHREVTYEELKSCVVNPLEPTELNALHRIKKDTAP